MAIAETSSPFLSDDVSAKLGAIRKGLLVYLGALRPRTPTLMSTVSSVCVCEGHQIFAEALPVSGDIDPRIKQIMILKCIVMDANADGDCPCVSVQGTLSFDFIGYFVSALLGITFFLPEELTKI